MKVIDLSTPFDMDHSIPQPHTGPYSSLDDYTEFTPLFTKAKYGFQCTKFTLATHCGTHLDAPCHRFNRDEKDGVYYLEDIPLDWLYGETVVLDMPKGPLGTIGAKDFENATMEIKEGDRVLVHTGWGRYFEKDRTKNHWWVWANRPGLVLDGAEWLVKRKVRAYGQDTIGTQHPSYLWVLDDKSREEGIPWMKEPVHDLLLRNDIILLEHLTNLDKVANRRIIAGFFPLPLKGMDGAPMRAVAFVED